MVDPSENNPIFKLEPFLPFYDENDPFICSLEKYKSDLIYHYENGFYNLALFSFHYLYMTIIHIFLLKYHRFDIDIINSCRQGKMQKIIAPYPQLYSDVHNEKRRIHLFSGIDNKIKELHRVLVATRDTIAHATGEIIDSERFNNHIENSFGVLFSLIEPSLQELIKGGKFKNTIQTIISEGDKGEYIDKITSFIQDFYITEIDAEYLTSMSIIDLSNYQSIKDSVI